MVDALQLNGWKTISIKYSADTNERTITAEYVEQPAACLKCGVIDRLYKHGFKDSTYIDSPAFNSSVRVVAKRQRYKCRDCGETFLQPVGGIDDDRRMTSRCRGEYTHDELTVADIEYPETGRIHKLPLCPECVRRFHG